MSGGSDDGGGVDHIQPVGSNKHQTRIYVSASKAGETCYNSAITVLRVWLVRVASGDERASGRVENAIPQRRRRRRRRRGNTEHIHIHIHTGSDIGRWPERP
jgi:hypothetical protein